MLKSRRIWKKKKSSCFPLTDNIHNFKILVRIYFCRRIFSFHPIFLLTYVSHVGVYLFMHNFSNPHIQLYPRPRVPQQDKDH